LLDGKSLPELISLAADVEKTLRGGQRSDSEYWGLMLSEMMVEIAKRKFREEYARICQAEREIIDEISRRHRITPLIEAAAISDLAQPEADVTQDQELDDEEKMKPSDEIALPSTFYKWYFMTLSYTWHLLGLNYIFIYIYLSQARQV